MLEATVGSLVSLAANIIYVDKKRKGLRGFGRLCAFWLGTPLTWLWFFVVPEGRRREIKPPRDDVDDLLEEIRRDKALRAARGELLTDGDQGRAHPPQATGKVLPEGPEGGGATGQRRDQGIGSGPV